MKEWKLTNEQIGSLCAALSHLVHAGIGTADALTLLQEEETDAALKGALKQMAQRADEGCSLASVFSQENCFPAYVCTLLNVAERVGKTEQTLAALADYYDRRAQMNRRIKAALTYPALLLGVLLAVVVILLVWVLPVFDDVYAQLGSRLTGLAGGLLAFGTALRKALPVLCVLLALGLCAALIRPVREKLLQFFKGRWGDRGVFAQLNSARFMQALSLALNSGMTAQEAVLLAADLAKEEAPAFQARCKCCLSLLDAGTALPQALKQTALLGTAHFRLLEAGMRSGQGEQVLTQLSQQLLLTSEEALEQEIGKIEPAMVAIACVLIGAVLLCVMLPLIHIMSAIG